MKDDYKELFAALSAFPRDRQDKMLKSLSLAEGDQMTEKEVRDNDVIWAAVPWSDIRDHPQAAAIRQAEYFRRMMAYGAAQGDNGGKVVFTVAGLASDPRELWEIPEIQRFCFDVYGLYPAMLLTMVNEDAPGLRAICPDDGERLSCIPGRLFFASLAFSGRLWHRQGDGIQYDAATARALLITMIELAAEDW